jgi:hypothetical protein
MLRPECSFEDGACLEHALLGLVPAAQSLECERVIEKEGADVPMAGRECSLRAGDGLGAQRFGLGWPPEIAKQRAGVVDGDQGVGVVVAEHAPASFHGIAHERQRFSELAL